MNLFDPDQHLRRLDEDKAVDGRGNKYRIERIERVEIHPFWILVGGVLLVIVLL